MSKDSTHQNRVTVIPANPEAVKERNVKNGVTQQAKN